MRTICAQLRCTHDNRHKCVLFWPRTRANLSLDSLGLMRMHASDVRVAGRLIIFISRRCARLMLRQRCAFIITYMSNERRNERGFGKVMFARPSRVYVECAPQLCHSPSESPPPRSADATHRRRRRRRRCLSIILSARARLLCHIMASAGGVIIVWFFGFCSARSI